MHAQELTTLIAQLVPGVPPPSQPASHIHVEFKLHTHKHAHAAPAAGSDHASSSGDLAARVQAMVSDMALHHNAHFDLEEQHLAPVFRKYFGIQRSRVRVCVRVHRIMWVTT